MARTDNLTNFLTDVAEAIKTKKGDDTPISASYFDEEILNLPSGGEEVETNLLDIAKPTLMERATYEKTENGYKITGTGQYTYVTFTVPLHETFKTCYKTLRISADIVASGNNIPSISFFWTSEFPNMISSNQLVKQFIGIDSLPAELEITQPINNTYKYLSILLYANVNGTISNSESVEYNNIKIIRNNLDEGGN